MASPINALLCAVIATAFWTLLGFALARHLLPRALALGAAAVIGWAAHSAVTLPIYVWIGFSPISVVAIGALCILCQRPFRCRCVYRVVKPKALPAFRHGHSPPPGYWRWRRPPPSCRSAHGDAVQLADPIFDHSKSAIVGCSYQYLLLPVMRAVMAAAVVAYHVI